MIRSSRPFRAPVLLALFTIATASAARADIAGFGDFSNFDFNQSDGNAAATIAPGTVHLTNNANGDVRSVFDVTRQTITTFTASFTFKAIGVPLNTPEFGACFVIQNDGPTTVASNNEGIQGTFGYQSWNGVFSRGLAVSLEYGSLATNSSATAIYTGGSVGAGAASTSPVNLFNGDPINVTLIYNGAILHENLLDTVTNASSDAFYVTNISSAIGSSSAWVGFTGNTTSASDAMDISNFSFTAAPEPASLSLLSLAAFPLLARRRPQKSA